MDLKKKAHWLRIVEQQFIFVTDDKRINYLETLVYLPVSLWSLFMVR